jgi:hypothetical protein
MSYDSYFCCFRWFWPDFARFSGWENGDFVIFGFCETPFPICHNWLMINVLIRQSVVVLSLWKSRESGGFHKINPEGIMATQAYLIPPEQLPPRVRYEKLFEHLPGLPALKTGSGRPPVSRDSLLRALVYKTLRRLDTLCALVFDLRNNEGVAAALGFSPDVRVPSVERFSSFLRDYPNEELQKIRVRLVEKLRGMQVIGGSILSIDSAPVVAPLKENNLKTSLKRMRFKKDEAPTGDPDAGLGIICHYPAPNRKEVAYFWGYRNHVMTDSISELPVWEVTYPADVGDLKPGRDALTWASEAFDGAIEAVTADAEYDAESILAYIINELNAKAVVPANPRNRHNDEYSIRQNHVYCSADLPMANKGKSTDRSTGITYRIYSCPLYWRKKMQSQYLFCPVQHPKYFSQKGCNVLIRLTPTVRSQMEYGTQKFIEVYNRRSSSERVFSRLLAVTAQEPSVRGLNATRNHITIAHISVLLVAAAAHTEGHDDKLRFVRTFVPNFLT